VGDRVATPTVRRGLVDPASASAEPFRTLRLALQLRTQPEVTAALLVTSAEPGAGKSTLAANYANLSALGGARVLIIDADLGHATQHEIFGVSRSPGLVEFVANWTPLEYLVHRVSPQLELDLLPAGHAVAHTVDVANSPRMADLLAEASEKYDIVIVDAPSVFATADAEAFGAHADIKILFVVNRTSRRRNVSKALRRLELVNGRVAGLVLNRDK
jgi:capsular exopolysaccharide synthesis family protein